MANSSSSSTTNKNNQVVNTEIDQFNDILHEQGDDLDEIDDADVDFDLFFTDFNKNEEEPELPKDIPWMNTTTNVASQKKRPALTPNTPTTPTVSKSITMKKKFKHQQEQEQEEGEGEGEGEGEEAMIPSYLSNSKTLFEDHIRPLLPSDSIISHDLLIEELRQLAVCEHQLQITELDIELWTVYLHSGTGKLSEDDNRSILQQLQYPLPTPPCIWPDKLKSIIMDDVNVSNADKANMTHTVYFKYVNQMLTHFENERRSYQIQIEQKIQILQTDLTSKIKETMIRLVQDYGITLYRIVNEGFIAAVQFTYKDRIVEQLFEREDHMHLCIDDFRLLTKSKMTAMKAKIEVQMLKQRVLHQQTSSILGAIQLPMPQDCQTIADETLRQRLVNRYEQLVQRTKSELLLIHIRTAEIKANELDREFDNEQKVFYQKLRANYSSSTIKNELSELMGRRFNLIEQRLQTLLDLKVRFFVKAPTVNKF